jgi:hypothetical protein
MKICKKDVNSRIIRPHMLKEKVFTCTFMSFIALAFVANFLF